MFYSDLDPSFYGYTFNSTNFVDNSFIDTVNNYIKDQELIRGGFGDSSGDDKDTIRNSRIHWMVDNRYKDTLMPLYDELTTKIREVNDSRWRLLVDGWDAFQYTEYDESYKGHYNWHVDYVMTPPNEPLSRKISFSLGISDIDDYEGGELSTKMDRNERSYKLDKGEIFVFPSWMLHRVTPVTKGKRKVIVGWGLGPVI